MAEVAGTRDCSVLSGSVGAAVEKLSRIQVRVRAGKGRGSVHRASTGTGTEMEETLRQVTTRARNRDGEAQVQR